MIVTITLQPSLDYYLTCNSLNKEAISNVENHFEIGGKGINVAKTVQFLKGNTLAYFVVNSRVKDIFEKDLSHFGVNHKIIITKEETRINVKLIGKVKQELNVDGSILDSKVLDEVKKAVKQFDKDTIIVLSGSVGSKNSVLIYQELMKENKNVKWVIDAKASLLASCIDQHPYLIKPNEEELQSLFERKLDTVEKKLDACLELIQKGVQNILLSLGENGAYFISTTEKIYVPSYPIKVERLVGCGDSLLGGFLSQQELGKSNQESLEFAVKVASLRAKSRSDEEYKKFLE